MPLINLITVEEADVINASNQEWLDLTEAQKTTHILQATLYIRTKFECKEEIDWEDTSTLSDEIKTACAYYADADRKGLLFEPISQPELQPHGKLIEHTESGEGFRETYRWAENGSPLYSNPLESIDALMMFDCSRKGFGYGSVTRV